MALPCWIATWQHFTTFKHFATFLQHLKQRSSIGPAMLARLWSGRHLCRGRVVLELRDAGLGGLALLVVGAVRGAAASPGPAEKFPVGGPVLAVGDGVHEGIHDSRGPCENRGNHVDTRV